METGTSSRRSFLNQALGLWGFATILALGGTIAQYLTPRRSQPVVRQTVTAGLVSDIEPGSTRIVRFNKEPVMIVHSRTGQIRAFSARCTHLGCIVEYKTDGEPHFGCNCHGSLFDMSGRNISGPAPRPLTPFRVTVDGSTIYLSNG